MSNGKTTNLVEEAVSLLADMPENAKVYITGAHTRHIRRLRDEFRAEGLKDVEFVTVPQIRSGYLNGRIGVLLIDDEWDLESHDRLALFDIQRVMNMKIMAERRRDRWTTSIKC